MTQIVDNIQGTYRVVNVLNCAAKQIMLFSDNELQIYDLSKQETILNEMELEEFLI